MNLDILNKELEHKGIATCELIENNKASEKYVRTTFVQADGFRWSTVVPYANRRTGMELKTEKEIANYLISIKPYFTMKAMEAWRENELKRGLIQGPVTSQFFNVLLSFREEYDRFPLNTNPARRIQDIKDAGYTIASVPRGKGRLGYNRILLPLPLVSAIGYEVFSPQFKARVIRLLKEMNAFEAKRTSKKALIPDHKFSEIRWDDATKAENTMEMSDDEIVRKFQLLDNQRNQQKREVCRRCFQEGVRGTIYGIKFFYEGDERWNESFPLKGKDAEFGCVGCPWYDIERWREKLNERLKED